MREKQRNRTQAIARELFDMDVTDPDMMMMIMNFVSAHGGDITEEPIAADATAVANQCREFINDQIKQAAMEKLNQLGGKKKLTFPGIKLKPLPKNGTGQPGQN